MVHFTVAVCKK